MELTVRRRERIEAPREIVWDEVSSIEVVAAKTPQISMTELSTDGSSGRLVVPMTWGPVRLDIEGTAQLGEVVDGACLHYRLMAPSLELTYEGTIELDSGGEDITLLDYSGVLRCEHRFARRLVRMLTEVAEDSLYSLCTRTRTRAEKRFQAQLRLG